MTTLSATTRTKLLFLVVLVLVAVMATACGAAGGIGGGLTEQQAIDAFVAERGDSIDPASVKVNGMTSCSLDEETKVALNIDKAWLVNYSYISKMSTLLTADPQQNIALAVGEKNGNLSFVAQGMCP